MPKTMGATPIVRLHVALRCIQISDSRHCPDRQGRATARWADVQSGSRPSFRQCLLDPSSESVLLGAIPLTTFYSGDRRVKTRARGVAMVKFEITMYLRARPLKPMPPADQARKIALKSFLLSVPGRRSLGASGSAPRDALCDAESGNVRGHY